MTTKKAFGSYFFPITLIAAILLGGLTGSFWGSITPYLKPFGEIFLNLIFTAIVPLIFLVSPRQLLGLVLWVNWVKSLFI